MSKNLSTVFKWRFSRSSQESINFESKQPDISFLRNNRTEETLTWIGHSTFLWQYRGINLITDPHLSKRASPVGFAGPERISPLSLPLKDLPDIDIVVISHNHYDHLDRSTVLGIVKKQKNESSFIFCSLRHEKMV